MGCSWLGLYRCEDLGQVCDLAVQKDGLGFLIFNAVNDEITNYKPSAAGFLARVCPDVPHTREMDARETSCTNKKMKETLGFCRSHLWQAYYEA